MSWLARLFGSEYPKIVAVVDPIDGGRNKGRFAFRFKRVHDSRYRTDSKAGDSVALSSIEDSYPRVRDAKAVIREIGFKGEIIVQDG